MSHLSGLAATASAPPNEEEFAARLLEWYDRHARLLPWRVGPAERRAGFVADPYRVWLSEIMLQQTTVAAVKPYFETFTTRWPTVCDLAAAPEDDLLAAWAGLGYYARARNLHAAARIVAQEHRGAFPETRARLRELPGIGAYTSAAIAAISFDEPVAAVDGNVERVVTRQCVIATPLAKAKSEIEAFVSAAVPADRPGDFAQALMDLGATICTPRNPACVLCPVRPSCRAAAAGNPTDYPVKTPKKARPARRGSAHVILRRKDGAVWLQKRPGTGMLGGMSGPITLGWSVASDGPTGAEAAPFRADWERAGSVEHGFTHFLLTLEVWRTVVTTDPPLEGRWSLDTSTEALPTLMRKAIAAAIPADGTA